MSLRPIQAIRPARPTGVATSAANGDAIRSILELAKLSLNTDAAKRDADGRGVPATDFFPDLVQFPFLYL